jgi:uncharacterized protein YvpB
MKLIPYPQLIQATNYDCGVIAVQEALLYKGIEIRYKKLLKLLKTTKAYGTSVKSMLKVLQLFEIKHYDGGMRISDLKANVEMGVPTIILLQAPTNNCLLDTDEIWDRGHWVTVVGNKRGKFVIEDPYVYERQEIKYSLLKARWHDKDQNTIYNQFGIAIL